jgi:prepilin-type N-terminal cleavage/methylation domain-containing protein
MNSRKTSYVGFTLIELLVVIAIIAILAIVVVLVLNPGQLIAQARDSNRIEDLATIKSALGYYLQDTPIPSLGAAGQCWMDGPKFNGVVTTSTCPWFVTASTTVNSTTTRSTSNGWMPVNVSGVSVGPPIAQWPADPSNIVGHAGGPFASGTDFFYSYAASTTAAGGYKVAANMESQKYSAGGPSDAETNDGGSSTSSYEQGTNLTL